MAGYIMTSRVREKGTILITQSFHQSLFCLGPSAGPGLLLRVLRGELPPEEADAAFDRHEAEQRAVAVETNLLEMHWRCVRRLRTRRQRRRGKAVE